MRYLRNTKMLLYAGMFLSGLASGGIAHADPKIPIDPSMVINEVAQGNASALVDEQTAAGDPAAGTGGAPANPWFPGWNSWYYPAGAVIDLGATYHVSSIYLYDTSGSGNVIVEGGTPFAWTSLFTDPQTGYNQWNAHPVSINTRYIHVILTSTTVPAEIVVYGTPQGTPVGPPAAVAPAPTPMDKFIGVNCLITDPLGLVEAAGTVREYHSWDWDEGSGAGQNAFSRDDNGWDFDAFYSNLNGLGLYGAPVLQGSVSWLASGIAYDDKPLAVGADPTNPASYAAHADHMWQIAARYGKTIKSDSLLKLKAGQPRSSGLGVLPYVENWNEPDKDWKGRTGYFTPYELAAMTSADYDGNLGSMGTTVGVKNADPNMQMSMAGLANGLNIDYIKAMAWWAQWHRGGSIPFDVINMHHYSTGTNTGISPEADNLKAKMALLVDYRNRYMQGKPVWVSEFGWDTNPSSPFRAPANSAFTAEMVQAQWLVRGYLALAAAGVDGADMFMLRDSNENSATQFDTSGLVLDSANGLQRKASWYFVSTLKNRFKGMVFDQEIASGNPNVLVYRFKNTAQSMAGYAVWCPTANGTTVANYQLSLQPSETAAKLITLTKGVADGNEGALTIASSKVSVNVSETPALVVTSSGSTVPKLYRLDSKLTLNSAMVTNESGQGNASFLVDEQTTAGDPAFGPGGAPSTVWSATTYPASAYIDLGQSYDISQIYLYDVDQIGNMTISAGSPGNWTPLFVDAGNGYMSWNAHATPVSTRYLRYTLSSATARASEIVVYTYGATSGPAPTATPTFSPAGGTYSTTQTVTISDATSGASIFYTTDGSTPTTASTHYTAPITVSASQTIKAIATAAGLPNSYVGAASYTIGSFQAATPTFSPASGTYSSGQPVTISDSTSGATIYYTTNGSTPTTSSAQYTAPIVVTSTQTIKAIAAASGFSNSAVASATYTISANAVPPPWNDIDIGSPGVAGSAASTDGVAFTVKGGGSDINGSTDQFNFCYQPMTGDGTIIARINSVQNTSWGAFGGVMIRESFSPTSNFADTDVSYSNGLYFQSRVLGQTWCTTSNASGSAPYWVKLVRVGGSVTGYIAPDSSGSAGTWTQLGSPQTLATGTVYAGLCVTAHDNTQLCTAAFSNVSVTGSGTSPAATPTFSPAGGTYTSTQSVTISDSTSGASIYYTVDGSTPTTSSTLYTAPISVSATKTIKAIAAKTGFSNSAVASATYTITATPQAATPTFSPAGGTYTSTQNVTLSDTTSGASIYYTTDGTTPTTSSTLYTAPISVSATKTIKAIATASGYTTSAVASATYTISATPQAATPTFSPAGGTYTSTQTVTISDTTSGASIYYTTDGSTPTASSTHYTAPITVSATKTVKAIAVASGYTNSAVASAAYTITVAGGLPSPWTDIDIGSPGQAGSATSADGSAFTIKGGGDNIWNSSDQFNFCYQPITGDKTITARVTSIQNTSWGAEAGVMIRENLSATSNFADMVVTYSNGIAFQYRILNQTWCGNAIASGGVSYWVRLVRVGGNVTAYSAPDSGGTAGTWTQMGSPQPIATGTVYFGLCDTAHDNTQLCTATIDHVTVN